MFGRFNDRRACVAEPEGAWIDRPRDGATPQNLEVNTRDDVHS
jgi:hypothetical protein